MSSFDDDLHAALDEVLRDASNAKDMTGEASLGFVAHLIPETAPQVLAALMRFALRDGRHASLAAYMMFHAGNDEQRSQLAKEAANPRRNRAFRQELTGEMLRRGYAKALPAAKLLYEEHAAKPKFEAFELLPLIARYDTGYFLDNMSKEILKAYNARLDEKQFWNQMQGLVWDFAAKKPSLMLNLIRTIAKTNPSAAEWTRMTLLSVTVYYKRFYGDYERAINLLSESDLSHGDQEVDLQ